MLNVKRSKNCIRIISDEEMARNAMLRVLEWAENNNLLDQFNLIDGNFASALEFYVSGYGVENEMETKQIIDLFFKFLRGE